MEGRVLLIVIVSASALAAEAAMADRRRYSVSEKIRDGNVLDGVFSREPVRDYIVSFEREPYGRIDRDDVRLIPDHYVLDRPAPSYGDPRAGAGGRIRGHQVLAHRKPVWRRS